MYFSKYEYIFLCIYIEKNNVLYTSGTIIEKVRLINDYKNGWFNQVINGKEKVNLGIIKLS